MSDSIAMPLHQRIRSDIERRILSGEWPPGFRIPVEHDLMRSYACARMTVNRAMAGLAAAGLIERRRRAGSFVARPTAQAAILDIPDVRSEVLALGLAYHHVIRRDAVRAASLEDRARLGDIARLRHIQCQHFAGGEPFAFEDRLIALDTVPNAEAVSFQDMPPGTWLLAHVPWTEAEHIITAIAADTGLARLLALVRHAPCLAIDRRTWRVGVPVTAVRLVFPGRSHRLIARFSPGERG